MALKTVEIEGKKYGELNDKGEVLYVDSDGKETGYDGETLAARLTQVNSESASRRHELKELNDKLETFKGIEDPAAAIKAMETIKNFDDKKLIEAGEVDKIKTEAIQGTETKYQTIIKEKYEPLEGQIEVLQGKLNAEIIGNRFANSPYIKEKLVVPAPMVQASFGKHVTIENDNLVIRYPNGEEVYSKSRPGDKADFDEALELLVDASSMRDYIVKGANHRGGTGGPGPGTGGGPDDGSQKVIKRSEFEKLDPQRKSDLIVKEGFQVVEG